MSKHLDTPVAVGHRDPIQMPSDRYFNDPEHVKELEDFGVDVEPVDLNRGFVPTEKYNQGNAKKTEDSIKRRFSL
jgi:hypothetical protein